MSIPDAANHDGKMILNGVERPTCPVDPAPGVIEVIKTQARKRNYVNLTLADDGKIVVCTSTEPAILLGTIGATADAVYGDVLRQVIDSGLTPTVEATTEMAGALPFVWLHFRQDPEELVWNKFKRRPASEAQPRLDGSVEAERRAKEALLSSRLNRDEMEARSLALTQYETTRKKGVVTWLLWLFLGSIGVHRYYLGDTKQGVLMTIAGLLGWVPGLAWCLIDGLFVNKRIRQANIESWTATATQHGVPVQPLPESAV